MNYLLAVALPLCAVYGAFALLMALAQRALMYPAPKNAQQPAIAGGRVERFPVEGDRQGYALYRPALPGRPTLVYFHGNAEQLASVAPLGESLAMFGMGFFAVEYPGYGMAAQATSSEQGLYAEATAALHHVTRALAIAPSDVVLVGRSLGSGVAVEMARRGHGCAVILISPYTSMVDMAQNVVPILPVTLLVRDRYDSISKAGEIDRPVLIVHGVADEVIPVAMARRLANVLPSAQLQEVSDAGHSDLFQVGGPQLLAQLVDFATDSMRSAPPAE